MFLILRKRIAEGRFLWLVFPKLARDSVRFRIPLCVYCVVELSLRTYGNCSRLKISTLLGALPRLLNNSQDLRAIYTLRRNGNGFEIVGDLVEGGRRLGGVFAYFCVHFRVGF